MSGAFGSSQWMYSSGAAGFYPYSIGTSLRFNDNDSARLSRTPSSAGNRKTSTLSVWVKRSKLGVDQIIFTVDAAANEANRMQFRFGSGDELRVAGQSTTYLATNAKFRDVSSWYHIVLAIDTTQATASDRLSLYVNGEKITSLSASSYPSQNADLPWNLATLHGIGSDAGGVGSGSYFDGYMAEVNFIDGTALDPTSFGETINGVWVPKAYDTADGAYGTNGFYLPFDDSAAIGDDESGNTNDWTANNLAASDVVLDSPTNNWCTFNPLDQNDVTGLTYPTVYSEGNLKLSQATGFINRKATFSLTSGKWYWEIKINDSSPDSFFGVSKSTGDARGALDNDEAMIRLTNGNLYTNAAETSYGTAFSNGDVCILAVDMDAGKFWAGRNGTWFASGDPAAGTNEGKSGLASELFPSVSLADGENCDVNFGQNGTFNGTKTAGGNSDGNGYGDFLYTVPSSFLALNSANLPEPTISPNAAEQADDYFNTVLYTGNGSTQSITGVGHQPDFVWIKKRSATGNHNLTDVIRGVDKYLFTNSTNAESTFSGGLSSFDSDGFSLAGGDTGFNASGSTYASWNWKAGGTAVSNTDGSITSSVSAAPDAGFSIVSYTGTGSAGATVGHGLGVVPELLIIRRRDPAEAWPVWVGGGGFSNTQYLRLNGTNAVDTATTLFNSTTPTSSVVTLGTGDFVNTNTKNYIMYAFASVESYCKVGSYVGNGSADGTFVYTGFRPAWVMVKLTNTTGHWNLIDSTRSPFNLAKERLKPSDSAAEDTARSIDFLSNGFKWRELGSAVNDGSYIYLAFAEAPFKYANAR